MPTFRERYDITDNVNQKQDVLNEAKRIVEEYATSNPASPAIKSIADTKHAHDTKAALGSPNAQPAYDKYLDSLFEFADAQAA